MTPCRVPLLDKPNIVRDLGQFQGAGLGVAWLRLGDGGGEARGELRRRGFARSVKWGGIASWTAA